MLVMGHIGLTPQSSGQLSGFKAQGRTADTAMALIEDAQAIQEAGAVKSNKIKKGATSDFMEIERQRGISVATSVLAFEYEAELLDVDPGTPLMLEKRLAFEQDGQPVEHGRDLYRGDRFSFVTDNAPLEF